MPRATYPRGGGQVAVCRPLHAADEELLAPLFSWTRFVERHGVLSWCLLPRARFRCYPPQTVSYSETHPLASNAGGPFPRAPAVVAPCLQHEIRPVHNVNENQLSGLVAPPF